MSYPEPVSSSSRLHTNLTELHFNITSGCLANITAHDVYERNIGLLDVNFPCSSPSHLLI
jgi:hypothetical protein